MSDGTRYDSIPETSLVADYYDNLHRAYRAMRSAFRRSGLTQDGISQLLGNAAKGLVSRWLSGKQNLTLKTLSRMASAMGCALIVEFREFDQLGHAGAPTGSNYFDTNDPTPRRQTNSSEIVTGS